MNAKLTKRNQQELEVCKRTFTITWQGHKPSKIDETFYHWCTQTRNPYVRIQNYRMRADVFMDLPNSSGLLDAEGLEAFRDLCLSTGFPAKGNSFKITHSVGMPKDKAPEFAQKLLTIGHAFCARMREAPLTNSKCN